MKKNIKKTVKPTYVVDLTDITNENDMQLAFAIAKHNAGQPLTDGNLEAIVSTALDAYIEAFPPVTVINCGCVCKKAPWYKRFWRWLTKPFKKNK